MTLKVGDQAPEFDLTASDGRRLVLSELRGKRNVVLYFYPGDFTPVCTAEACGFRDDYPQLAGKETEVIGVSKDDDTSHGKFAQKHQLPFPLVTDPERKLATAYGAVEGLRALLGGVKRVTYVIDKQGRIAGVFDSQLRAGAHTKGVRELIDRLQAQA
jgi:peroxiredoxin Q/BCP